MRRVLESEEERSCGDGERATSKKTIRLDQTNNKQGLYQRKMSDKLIT